jgi:hypothetical protein
MQRQVDGFTDANPRRADEQECIRVEIIGSAQFLLQELILLRGKGPRQIAGFGWEVLATNEIGLQGMAVGSESVEQTAKGNKISYASGVAEGWLSVGEPTEPAEQMKIPAQLR